MNIDLHDEQVIQENTDYVLGMVDLYPDDAAIEEALRVKGLDRRLIPIILQRARVPAYQKRMRQATGQIILGLLLFLLCTGIYFGIRSLPGAEDTLKSNRQGLDFLIWQFKVYREVFYILWLLTVFQVVSGFLSLRRYATKLKALI